MTLTTAITSVEAHSESIIEKKSKITHVSINEKIHLDSTLEYNLSPLEKLKQIKFERERKLQVTLEAYQAARVEQDRLAELERQRKIAEAKRKEAEEREKKKQIQVSRSTQEVHRSFTVEATGYVSDCYGCSGTTKSGKNVTSTIHHKGNRIIAVDRDVIPLYSIVKVEHEGVSFIAYALDIGGGIKGYEIDILMSSEREAYSFGRRKVSVSVLREGRGN